MSRPPPAIRNRPCRRKRSCRLQRNCTIGVGLCHCFKPSGSPPRLFLAHPRFSSTVPTFLEMSSPSVCRPKPGMMVRRAHSWNLSGRCLVCGSQESRFFGRLNFPRASCTLRAKTKGCVVKLCSPKEATVATPHLQISGVAESKWGSFPILSLCLRTYGPSRRPRDLFCCKHMHTHTQSALRA